MPATSDWGSQESESGELSLEWNTRQLEAVHRREKKTKGGNWCSTTQSLSPRMAQKLPMREDMLPAAKCERPGRLR